MDTGILHRAKFYFSHRATKQRMSVRHALKLNVLRYYPIVLQYYHSEIITVRKDRVAALISDLCDSEPLERWICRHLSRQAPEPLFGHARLRRVPL